MVYADRHPSGQVVRHGQEDVRRIAVVQRMKRELEEDALHELNGFPLGRLYVLDRITEEQYGAGCRWAEQTTRLMHVNGFSPPRCQAILIEGLRGKSLASEIDPEKLEALRRYCFRAENVILALGGKRGLNLVRSTVLNDEPCEDVPLLKRCLTGLAALVTGKR